MKVYKLKNYKNIESWRENIEFNAQQLRIEADLLKEKALTMENMAREIYCNLEEVQELSKQGVKTDD